jgi:hypothetical protein
MSLPPSSPRLPSPPPPTEIQIGPKSPSMGSSNNLESTIEQSVIDANAKRRIHPGTKSADMAAGPPLVPLNEVCSTHNTSLRNVSDRHIARFRLSTTRTSQSSSPSLHQALRLRILRPHKPRDRKPHSDPTRRCRSRPMALRTLPLSHKQMQRANNRISLRRATMFGNDVSRNAG